MAVGLWLIPGPRTVGGLSFDVNTLLYAATAVLIGFQSVLFAVFTKVYGINVGLLPKAPRIDTFFKYVTLETGLIVGIGLTLLGLIGTLAAVSGWASTSFGPLDPSQVQRIVIPSVLALALGLQTTLASFFLSVLGLRRVGGRGPN